MADIFISYAHEDQAFVRHMVPPLEAEGFSVWWDHTIPPGKSWDTFIARGIAEARCCMVVWSPHSVESDWVKEEATLGKDAGKLLPIVIDKVEPPVGFRRIQAANLTGWNSDANNAQWQLLLSEARNIVGASRESGAPSAPIRHSPPTPAKPKTLPVGAIVGIGFGAAAVVAATAFIFLNQQDEPSATAETRAIEAAVVAPIEPLEEPGDSPPASRDNEELERLRRERDAAVQQAEEARIAQRRQQTAARSDPAPTPPAIDLSGYWRGYVSWQGDNNTWQLAQRVSGEPTAPSQWSLNGDHVVFMDCCGNRFDGRLSGNTITGTTTGYLGPGTFRIERLAN